MCGSIRMELVLLLGLLTDPLKFGTLGPRSLFNITMPTMTAFVKSHSTLTADTSSAVQKIPLSKFGISDRATFYILYMVMKDLLTL